MKFRSKGTLATYGSSVALVEKSALRTRGKCDVDFLNRHTGTELRSVVGMTMALQVTVRPSRDEDVEAMLAIYRYHIARGVDPDHAHESEPMQPDDLKRRRKNMRKRGLPHLVAELGGAVVGYAYVVLFRKRPAYRFTLKHSIYVHPDHLHAGIGRALLPALIDACAAAGYRQMIGYIDASNQPSLRLHEAYGFKQVGYLPSVGYKFTRWTDVVMVQRSLGAGCATPPDVWPAASADDE